MFEVKSKEENQEQDQNREKLDRFAAFGDAYLKLVSTFTNERDSTNRAEKVMEIIEGIPDEKSADVFVKMLDAITSKAEENGAFLKEKGVSLDTTKPSGEYADYVASFFAERADTEEEIDEIIRQLQSHPDDYEVSEIVKGLPILQIKGELLANLQEMGLSTTKADAFAATHREGNRAFQYIVVQEPEPSGTNSQIRAHELNHVFTKFRRAAGHRPTKTEEVSDAEYAASARLADEVVSMIIDMDNGLRFTPWRRINAYTDSLGLSRENEEVENVLRALVDAESYLMDAKLSCAYIFPLMRVGSLSQLSEKIQNVTELIATQEGSLQRIFRKIKRSRG